MPAHDESEDAILQLCGKDGAPPFRRARRNDVVLASSSAQRAVLIGSRRQSYLRIGDGSLEFHEFHGDIDIDADHDAVFSVDRAGAARAQSLRLASSRDGDDIVLRAVASSSSSCRGAMLQLRGGSGGLDASRGIINARCIYQRGTPLEDVLRRDYAGRIDAVRRDVGAQVTDAERRLAEGFGRALALVSESQTSQIRDVRAEADAWRAEVRGEIAACLATARDEMRRESEALGALASRVAALERAQTRHLAQARSVARELSRVAAEQKGQGARLSGVVEAQSSERARTDVLDATVAGLREAYRDIDGELREQLRERGEADAAQLARMQSDLESDLEKLSESVRDLELRMSIGGEGKREDGGAEEPLDAWRTDTIKAAVDAAVAAAKAAWNNNNTPPRQPQPEGDVVADQPDRSNAFVQYRNSRQEPVVEIRDQLYYPPYAIYPPILQSPAKHGLGMWASHPRAPLVFYAGEKIGYPIERMRLTPKGRLGISTTAPRYDLDVDGRANAREFLEDGVSLSARYARVSDVNNTFARRSDLEALERRLMMNAVMTRRNA